MNLLAPRAFLQNKMTDFPSLSYTSTSKSLTIQISGVWNKYPFYPFWADPSHLGRYRAE